jgi:hypothetical protein
MAAPLFLFALATAPTLVLSGDDRGDEQYVEKGNMPALADNDEVQRDVHRLPISEQERDNPKAPYPTQHDGTQRRPNDYVESWVVCSQVVCADLMPPKDSPDPESEFGYSKEDRSACLFGCRAAMEGSLLVEDHCGEYCEGIFTDPLVAPHVWEHPTGGQREHWENLCTNRCLQGYAIHKPVIEEQQRKKAEARAAREAKQRQKSAERAGGKVDPTNDLPERPVDPKEGEDHK